MATLPARLQFPVEVIGSDVFGQQFFEQAQTLTIHRNGVSILLANKLAPDSEVIVRNPDSNAEALASVVGQFRSDEAGQVYGLVFHDPSVALWPMPIPVSGPAKTVAVDCSGCGSVCVLDLSGVDLEIFDATHELTRPCKECKSSRVWRETKREVKAAKPKVPPLPAPALPKGELPKVELPQDDRRKARRMAMKASACIRCAGMDVEVACEDISKGGFRFTSRKEYPEGTRFEAAVPYVKLGNNIFSPASVVFCLRLPDGQFRHGVAYIKTSGPIGWDRG